MLAPELDLLHFDEAVGESAPMIPGLVSRTPQANLATFEVTTEVALDTSWGGPLS